MPHHSPSASLLVREPAALDLEAVRVEAARHGWTVDLQRLDGTPADAQDRAPVRGLRLAVPLRLEVRAASDAPVPDVQLLVRRFPALAVDETHRRPSR